MLKCARGVIYVIDSTSIQKNLKDVAEYLFDLLTDASLARSRTPFLILCNKADLPDAKKVNVIEELLEMELYVIIFMIEPEQGLKQLMDF